MENTDEIPMFPKIKETITIDEYGYQIECICKYRTLDDNGMYYISIASCIARLSKGYYQNVKWNEIKKNIRQKVIEDAYIGSILRIKAKTNVLDPNQMSEKDRLLNYKRS